MQTFVAQLHAYQAGQPLPPACCLLLQLPPDAHTWLEGQPTQDTATPEANPEAQAAMAHMPPLLDAGSDTRPGTTIPVLDLEKLAKQLRQQANAAETLLLQWDQQQQALMGNMPSGYGALKQITTALTELPPAQQLATVLLSYLPYLPVALLPPPPPWPEPWTHEPPAEDEEGASQGPTVVLWLQTVTLGRLQARVALKQATQLHLQLRVEEAAKVGVSQWEEAFSQWLVEKALPACIWELTYLETPSSRPTPLPETPAGAPIEATVAAIEAQAQEAAVPLALPAQAPEALSRRVALEAPPKAPTLLVHAAYHLARLVFDLDVRQETQRQRRL
jgi:hypothetical protein